MSVKARGDTIVEVIIAFTIFAMAAVAAVAIMNRGIAMAQRSLETTLVRQQIDSQADMLRYVRDNSTPAWAAVVSAATTTTPSTTTPSTCPTDNKDLPVGSFYMQPSSTVVNRVDLYGGASSLYSSAETYARFDSTKSYGMWVQPVKVAGGGNAYDMYINACWDTVGSERPLTLRTIVRLYES